MIRVFEAFAGIGGFRSALEKTGGFEIVGWCEINHFAQKAYRLLFDTGKEEFYEDITKIDYGTMPDFDLLVGGPPCQSWSAAGLRKGFEDDRGNLFLEYIRLLEAKKPKYFVAENVAGLLSHSQGKSYGIILEKICELGYSMCWRVLNSADFGVAQDRKRVYLVGYLGERSPAEILAFGESGNEDSNDSGEKTKLKQLIGGSILLLKTLPDCLVIRRGKATESSLKRFANWGIVCAGVCLTAQISESPRTGKECILSDILEKEVPPKYWLSEKAAMKIAMTAEKKQS